MPDRQRLFELFETDVLQAAITADTAAAAVKQGHTPQQPADRTISLIDTFLGQQPQPQPKQRRPRPAEAAVDYTAYLLQLDDAQPMADEQEEPKVIPAEPVKLVKPVEQSPQKIEETADDEVDDV